MPLTKEQKQEIMTKYGKTPADYAYNARVTRDSRCASDSLFAIRRLQ